MNTRPPIFDDVARRLGVDTFEPYTDDEGQDYFRVTLDGSTYYVDDLDLLLDVLDGYHSPDTLNGSGDASWLVARAMEQGSHR